MGWLVVAGALVSDPFLVWGLVTKDPQRKDLRLGRERGEHEREGEPKRDEA